MISVNASREKSSNNSAQICGRKVKLPKLELRKFSGKIVEWPEFWDGFRSAVHDDEQLAKVDKFKYLRSYLEEPARSVVAGFPLTDADYDSAIEMLKDRFAKPSVIKRVHLNDLALLPPVHNEKNVHGLRRRAKIVCRWSWPIRNAGTTRAAPQLRGNLKVTEMVGTHVMEVFNEVKRYWTRSTQVEAKYTLNFI